MGAWVGGCDQTLLAISSDGVTFGTETVDKMLPRQVLHSFL